VALDLRDVAASTGSACASGKQEVSHVVSAMGLNGQEAREVIRLSLDWSADAQMIEKAVPIIAEAVFCMRCH
jgi:cysteine desulfurase